MLGVEAAGTRKTAAAEIKLTRQRGRLRFDSRRHRLQAAYAMATQLQQAKHAVIVSVNRVVPYEMRSKIW